MSSTKSTELKTLSSKSSTASSSSSRSSSPSVLMPSERPKGRGAGFWVGTALHAVWALSILIYYLVLLGQGFQVWIYFTCWSLGLQTLFYCSSLVGFFYRPIRLLVMRCGLVLVAGLTAGVAVICTVIYSVQQELFWSNSIDATASSFACSFFEHFLPLIAFILFCVIYREDIPETYGNIAQLKARFSGVQLLWNLVTIAQATFVLLLPWFWISWHNPTQVYGWTLNKFAFPAILMSGMLLGLGGFWLGVFIKARYLAAQPEDEESMMTIQTDVSREKVLRMTSIFMGLLIMLCSGSMYTFSAFSSAFKAYTGFNQQQVNFIASTGYSGLNLVGILAGMLYDRFKNKVMSLTAMVISCSGFLLMWAVVAGFIATPHYLLVAFFYFVVGSGLCFMYMNPLLTNIHNISANNRGIVLGLQDGMFGLSGVLFSTIYSATFGRPSEVPLAQDLPGYMLCLAIVCAGVNLLGLFLLRVVPAEPVVPVEKDDNLPLITAEGEDLPQSDFSEMTSFDKQKLDIELGRISISFNESTQTQTSESVKVAEKAPVPPPGDGIDVHGKSLLTNVNFWLLFMVCLLGPGAPLMYMNNVGFILEAFNAGSQITVHAILTTLCATIARLGCGPLSDYLLRTRGWTRAYFYLGAHIVLLVLNVLCIFALPYLVIPASIVSGLGFGAIWCVTPMIVSEEWGVPHFGSNWGWLMFSPAISGVVFQLLSGAIYDANAIEGTTACYGMECYRLTFVICSILVAVSLVLSIFLFRRLRLPSWAKGQSPVNTMSVMTVVQEVRVSFESKGSSSVHQIAIRFNKE